MPTGLGNGNYFQQRLNRALEVEIPVEQNPDYCGIHRAKVALIRRDQFAIMRFEFWTNAGMAIVPPA